MEEVEEKDSDEADESSVEVREARTEDIQEVGDRKEPEPDDAEHMQEESGEPALLTGVESLEESESSGIDQPPQQQQRRSQRFSQGP